MKRWRIALIGCLIVLLAGAVSAAPKNRPRNAGRNVTIPEAGVKLRMVPGVEMRMLPPLLVRATRKSDGAPCYLAKELWLHEQLQAHWEGEGVDVLLAAVKFAPPVKPKDYLRSVESAKWRAYGEVPDDAELRRWAAAFFGDRVGNIVKVDDAGNGVAWRRLQTADRGVALFVGHGRPLGRLRILMLRVAWRGATSRDRAAESCARSVQLIPVSARGEGSSAASSSGTSGSSSTPDIYAERREQAKKSIAGMRGWYIRETPNYIFVSNQRSHADIRRLQGDLEAAREIFRRYFPAENDRACVGVVKLFARREEYLAYVGPELKWTGGLWNSGTRELLVSPLDPRLDDKIIEKRLREVTLHEGFHQYIFYASREVGPALWFNEGCAQFFENSRPRQGEVGNLDRETQQRLTRAAQAAEPDLKRFLSLDHAGFYAEKEREQNYALAHALMYYLLRGAPANGEKAYAAIPRRYIAELRRTRNLEQAQGAAFEGIDTRELSAKLKRFWSDSRQLRRSRGY